MKRQDNFLPNPGGDLIFLAVCCLTAVLICFFGHRLKVNAQSAPTEHKQLQSGENNND